MHFLCMKWGNKYSPDYVNNLYKMVKENYSKRHKFICYTDDPEGIDKNIKIRTIPKVDSLHPDFWFGKENYCWDRSKFLVLNSHRWLRTKGPFCYLDLDVVIQNNIDDIFELSKTPHMIYTHWEDPSVLKDRRFQDVRGTLYNSSVMLWCNNEGEKIYNDVIKHKDVVYKTFWKGTDNYYPWREYQVVGDNYWSFLPKDWVYSYNRGQEFPNDLTEHLYRETAKFCIFDSPTGRPQTNYKPHEVRDYNILVHWHGKNDFERLWMPKFPDNFFDKNKHTERIDTLIENANEYDSFVKQIESRHRKTIEELENDLISMHKKFLADFPKDPLLIEGNESLYWNKDIDGIYNFYKDRFVYKMHKVVFNVLVDKFYTDLPKLKQDWEKYSNKFDSIKNWSQFDSMTDDTLEKNYIDQKVISKIKYMVNQNDLTSLASLMIELFPELEKQLQGSISEIKENIPELEKEISDLTFIRRIEPEHRKTIREIYDTGDMISMHKKFLADFPEDKMLQDGDQALYWNKSFDGVYDFYKERYISRQHKIVFDEAKKYGPVRYFWNINYGRIFALYRRLWHKNELPLVKKEFMENVKRYGIQRLFWDADNSDTQKLYKRYYIDNLKELFYKQDYEAVFERLYNIMPKDELLNILKQDNISDDDTLVKYFQMHGEQYSDMYKGLYEDGSPDGALIQLSSTTNDTDDPYNDIFLTEYEHNLSSIKKIFDRYRVNWVTLMCEISDPTKSEHFENICKYFKDNGVTLTVQTYDKTFMKPSWIDNMEYVEQPELTENMPVVKETIASDIPVNLDTLRMFKKRDEVRRPKPKSKVADPVWCDARKSGYFYVSADSGAYPCAWIARDVLENKLLPYHPLDYAYNNQYNNLKNFTVGEVIYNNDFENISQNLKRSPLSICNKKCGDCHAS